MTNVNAIKMLDEVLVGHEKLAIVFNQQSNLILLGFRQSIPFRGFVRPCSFPFFPNQNGKQHSPFLEQKGMVSVWVWEEQKGIILKVSYQVNMFCPKDRLFYE